jgi:predicted RNA-binding protein with PUA-like domain
VAYWLLKTEPDDYSWANLVRDKSTRWDGVTSAPGLKQIRAVKQGDQGVLYHTGDERRAMGIVTITSGPYADPREDDEKLVVFDLRAGDALATPVELATMKKDRAFAGSPLVVQGRLAVVPLTAAQWKRLLALAKG